MMAELALVAKATVILGCALVATRLARRAPASVRALILAAAFGTLLVLPAFSALTPPREVQIPATMAPAFFVDERVTTPPGIINTAPRQSVPESASTWHVPSARALTRGVWLLGALATLLPLAVGLWRVRAIRRCGRDWVDATAGASELRAVLGLRRTVTVVLHDGISTPVTCGWLRPAIIMPVDAVDWRAEDIRQALLHELEHVRRRDWPVHILARVTCALYWFHPAAWMAWRQLSLESERACDDAVVARTENTAYAEQLVSLARRAAGHAAPLLSMADRRTLATRVASILSTTVSRGRAGVVASALVLTGAAALSAVIGPVTPVGAQNRDAIRIPMAADGPAFDVVSVKANEPDDRLRVNDWQPATGRLVLRNLTPKTMLTAAYANTATLFLPDERLLGVPEWADRERFTIEAVAGRPVTASEMQRMLRRVLVERFGLRVHLEQREQTAYRLTLARADGHLGPNLKRAEEGTCRESRRARGGGEWGTQELRCVTLDLLALDLSERLGRPVIDQTSLTGIFDGTLTYSPSPEELAVIYQLAPSELPPAAFTGPALTTALTEQLGLKLESTRAAVDVLVVDAIDRPTPNDAPNRGAGVGGTGAPAAQNAANVAQRPPAFDVVSIRPNTGSNTSIPFGPTPADGFSGVNRPLESLVRYAYDVQYFRVINMPAWANQERFDITAKAGRTITDPERRLMMRQLLADRFGLKVHFETRDQTVHVMTWVRSDGRLGPGLKPRPECLGAAEQCVSAGSAIGPAGRLSLKAATLDLLASGLMSAVLESLVINESNVPGHFDVELSWRLDTAAADADARPSFMTAVEEQLGLKLTAQRRPVQVLVIDQIQRPTAN
jgi:uncharacterized protein (TIGR03435 family)